MIPLPLLPEIFFYDIDKEKQVYDDPPRAIFRLNIIGNMSGFDLRLRPYTDRWFSTLTKVFTDNFKDQLGEIASFVMGKDKKEEEEEDEYARLKMAADAMDDELDEEAEVEGDTQSEVLHAINLLKFIKGVAEKVKKFLKWLRKVTKFLLRLTRRIIRRLKKWTLKGIKLLTKTLKIIIQRLKKLWKLVLPAIIAISKRVKPFMIKLWTFLCRLVIFIIKSLRPFLNSAIRGFVFLSIRAGKIFSFLFKRHFWKYLKPVLLRMGKAVISKLPLLLGKLGVGRVLALMGKATLAVASLPANLAPVIGQAINVGLIVWTAYDIISLFNFIVNELPDIRKEVGSMATKMESIMDENGGFRYKTPKEISELLSTTNEYKDYDFSKAREKAEEARTKRIIWDRAENTKKRILATKQAQVNLQNFYSKLDEGNNTFLSMAGRLLVFQRSIEAWLHNLGTQAMTLGRLFLMAYNNFRTTILAHIDKFSYKLPEILTICYMRMPKRDPKKIKQPKHIKPSTPEEENKTFWKEMQPLLELDKEIKDSFFPILTRLPKYIFDRYKGIQTLTKEDGEAYEGTEDLKSPIKKEFYGLSHDKKEKWLKGHKNYIARNMFGKNYHIVERAPNEPLINYHFDTHNAKHEELEKKRDLLEQILSRFLEIQKHQQLEAT